MKNRITAIFASALLFASCEEFEPVVTFRYDNPQNYEQTDGDNVVAVGEIVPNTTIAALAATYKNGKPAEIKDNIIIAGRVTTTDKPGNFYKSLYIQDETGAIELKIGKNSLHNDYKEGQMVYVKCGPGESSKGLFLGSYGFKSGSYGGNGMAQLGCEDPTGEYETSYIMLDYILKDHIFRGPADDIKKVEPEVISESQLPSSTATLATCPYIGKLVTLKGLKYDKQAFALLYINGNESNKNSKNRVFLSDKMWGIDSWAMSKVNFLSHLRSGEWDDADVGNANDYNYGTVGAAKLDYVKETDPGFYENLVTLKDESYAHSVYKTVYGKDFDPATAPAEMVSEGRIKPEALAQKWVRYCLVKNANGYSVSQYFKMGSHEIQLRTSGFSKFSDSKIPQEVIDGTKTIDVTGILSLYQGNVQFVVNSIDDIKVN